MLIPKMVDGKKVLSCSCGYTGNESDKMTFSSKVEQKEEKKFDIADPEQEDATMPTTEAECSKCGNRMAYWWEVQTRAGDEPATKFLKCTKCKHVWRDYS